jgi:hypothetical protein
LSTLDCRRPVRANATLGPLISNDVEPFVLGWRLEVHSDRIELSIRGPVRPGRKRLAPLPQLQLTEIIGNVSWFATLFRHGKKKRQGIAQ